MAGRTPLKVFPYASFLTVQVNDATGTWVHISTICRTVHRLGFTRKRLQHIALQRSTEKRAEYMAEISIFNPSMLVWVDETGFRRRNSIRAYGYSMRGMRATDYQLRVGNKSINAIGIMSLDGVEDVYISEENVNGDVFEEFENNPPSHFDAFQWHQQSLCCHNG